MRLSREAGKWHTTPLRVLNTFIPHGEHLWRKLCPVKQNLESLTARTSMGMIIPRSLALLPGANLENRIWNKRNFGFPDPSRGFIVIGWQGASQIGGN